MFAKLKPYLVAVPLALLLAAGVTLAATLVDQGAGNPNQIPWRVTLTDASGAPASTGTPPAIAAGAPAYNVSISAVTTSRAVTAGNYYRVACNTDASFRFGTGATSAVTTDAAFYAPAVEYLRVPSGANTIAFITTSASGTCTISSLTY